MKRVRCFGITGVRTTWEKYRRWMSSLHFTLSLVLSNLRENRWKWEGMERWMVRHSWDVCQSGDGKLMIMEMRSENKRWRVWCTGFRMNGWIYSRNLSDNFKIIYSCAYKLKFLNAKLFLRIIIDTKLSSERQCMHFHNDWCIVLSQRLMQLVYCTLDDLCFNHRHNIIIKSPFA